jgi:hypothetical protein
MSKCAWVNEFARLITPVTHCCHSMSWNSERAWTPSNCFSTLHDPAENVAQGKSYPISACPRSKEEHRDITWSTYCRSLHLWNTVEYCSFLAHRRLLQLLMISHFKSKLFGPRPLKLLKRMKIHAGLRRSHWERNSTVNLLTNKQTPGIRSVCQWRNKCTVHSASWHAGILGLETGCLSPYKSVGLVGWGCILTPYTAAMLPRKHKQMKMLYFQLVRSQSWRLPKITCSFACVLV